VVCGGLWVLAVWTVLEVIRPEALTAPLAVGVWGLTGLVVAIVTARPGSPRQVWGRAVLTMGLHALALPVAAVLSFAATGFWSPADTVDPWLSLDALGVRLVGTPAAVRLGVGGFFLGLLLVSIGDRALRSTGAARIGRGDRF
jgi:hypothetical protein